MLKKTINAIKTSWKGLSLTLKHFFAIGKKRESVDIKSDKYFDVQEGQVTLQYPKEKIPIPEVGRYQLHVEMDDCIACDLCAKICPVDCIEIESIKATGPIGQTSDGTTKRLYAAKFDIDMAKCLYCGLCTVVCPTECITMTNQYDRSVTHISELTYKFSDMTPEEAEEKRRELALQQAEKQAAKEAAAKPATPKLPLEQLAENRVKATPKLPLQQVAENKNTATPKLPLEQLAENRVKATPKLPLQQVAENKNTATPKLPLEQLAEDKATPATGPKAKEDAPLKKEFTNRTKDTTVEQAPEPKPGAQESDKNDN